MEGHAEILNPHTVTLEGKKFTTKYILVAVGSWPSVPKFPGSEYAITSNEAFYLPSLPKTVIIVGGGYIGVEFAGIFHGLGAHTIQLYRGESFLRGFDDDIRTTLAAEMLKRGIDLRFDADINRIKKVGDISSRDPDGWERDSRPTKFYMPPDVCQRPATWDSTGQEYK